MRVFYKIRVVANLDSGYYEVQTKVHWWSIWKKYERYVKTWDLSLDAVKQHAITTANRLASEQVIYEVY